MVKYWLKKTFFNGWDNLGRILLMNIASLLAVLGCIATLYYSQKLPFYYVSLIIFGFFTVFSALMFGITNNEILILEGIKDWKTGFKRALKGHISHVLFLALIWSIFVISIVFVIPFYLQAATTVYWIIACIIFWVILFGFPCVQFFIPMTLRNPKEKPSEILRRCFAISADNKAFTLLLTVRSILDIAISIFSCGLVPGFSGIALNCNEALAIIVKRHNFCESTGLKRKDINYQELFEEEIKAIGKRTLRTMIFPWKS